LFGRIHRAQSVSLLWVAYRIGVDLLQHNFSKNGVILHACVHGHRKEFFQGALVKFFQQYFRRGTSGEICFLPLETKKTVLFAEIYKFLPLFRHPCLCVGKVRAAPLKTGAISSVLTPFETVKFY